MRVPKDKLMFNFIDSVIDKIFADPSVNASSFKYDAAVAIGSNFIDEAEFISGHLVSKAKLIILEKLSIANFSNGNPEAINSDLLDRFAVHARYTADCFAKVEEVANMIAAYEE